MGEELEINILQKLADNQCHMLQFTSTHTQIAGHYLTKVPGRYLKEVVSQKLNLYVALQCLKALS